MKKILIIGILFLTFSSCQQQKIGFIDTGEIVNEYQEKKDLEEEFKGKKALLDQKNDSISKAFQLEVQDFQLKSARMNQKKAQEKYQELGQRQQLLQQQIQFSEQQFGQSFNTELDSVITKVKDFTKEYGKNNGYTFILGTSDATSSVIYGDDATDLTKTILEALNAAYKD
jgi:outer membrane protein